MLEPAGLSSLSPGAERGGMAAVAPSRRRGPLRSAPPPTQRLALSPRGPAGPRAETTDLRASGSASGTSRGPRRRQGPRSAPRAVAGPVRRGPRSGPLGFVSSGSAPPGRPVQPGTGSGRAPGLGVAGARLPRRGGLGEGSAGWWKSFCSEVLKAV